MEAGDPTVEALRKELADRDARITRLNAGLERLRSEAERLKTRLLQRDEAIKFLRMELSYLSPDPAKQRMWWDAQFAGPWEANSGPAQSTYFMQRLVEGLGDVERRFLYSRRLRVLDWGCATGDGLRVLADAFPECDAVGMDLSQIAVETAQRKFPDLSFVSTPDGELHDEFDVIVTSNTLEHFAQPIEWLQRLLAAARWLVVVLVPYREAPLMEGHKASFSEETFPPVLGGFTRLYARLIPCDAQFWAGAQIQAAYGSPAYLAQAGPSGPDA